MKDVHSFQIPALVLMDQICFAMNKLTHEAITLVPLNTLRCIKNTTEHHLLAWQNSNLVNWDPPPLGSFKVNFDVVIHPTFAVAVAVLRDHSRKFLAFNTLKQPYWPPDWLSQWATPP
jgi:hypothetical protein